MAAHFSAKAVGKMKQEWNKKCNEACEKQVLKQVKAAYEDAAWIAESEGDLVVAGKIRARLTLIWL